MRSAFSALPSSFAAPGLARPLARRLLRLLVSAAEEPGGTGDVRVQYRDTPFPRSALLCFGSGHFPGLLGVFGDQRGEKYVAADAHGAAVLDHAVLLPGCSRASIGLPD